MRILQQALTLEAENGFKNLEGRQENFHAFLVRQLAEPPSGLLPTKSQARLSQLAEAFASYPDSSESARRRLVTDSRQLLHGIRQGLEPPAPIGPPLSLIHI